MWFLSGGIPANPGLITIGPGARGRSDKVKSCGHSVVIAALLLSIRFSSTRTRALKTQTVRVEPCRSVLHLAGQSSEAMCLGPSKTFHLISLGPKIINFDSGSALIHRIDADCGNG